jgi:peptidoglycan/LPS O-acetylase OafA/YrhL
MSGTAPPQAATPRLPHRPALDGVRALAVTAVLLYHGGVAVPGGYLGVDVFLVLSGYLITSLLTTEWLAAGRIDLRAFWFRRARRLLPALVLVLLLVAGYAATLAPEIVRDRLRGDALATLLYVANWHFIANGVSYFEQYATPTPLLHTWSLAIEEQFYLVWPLLLLLLLRPALGRGGGRRWVVVPVAAALVGAVASAVWMALLHTPGLDPSRVYYGTDTRAQALLVGAAAGVVAVRTGRWHRAGTSPGWAPEAAGWAGLAVLAVMVARVPDSADAMYRGGFLLAAVAALGLVWAAAAPGRGPLQRVLASPPLRAVGVVSYGLYLWHWPLYVILTPVRTGLDGTGLLVLRLVVTGVVSAFSWVLVERRVRGWRPARRGSPTWWPWTPPVLGAVAGAAAACMALVVVATVPGPVGPPPSSDDLVAASAPSPVPSPVATSSSGDGAQAAPVSVWLLGDSVAYGLHAEHPPDPSYGVTASGLTRLGCNLSGGQIAMDGVAVPSQDFCAEWPQNWRDSIAEVRPDVAVLMPGNGELFDHVVDGRELTFGTPEYRDFLEGWIDEDLTVMAQSANAVAVTTVPCYDKPDTGLDSTPRFVNDVERQRWVNQVIRDHVAAHPEVHLIDLRSAVCDGDTYVAARDGVTLRSDGVHWTPEGADLVWRFLAQEARAVAGNG